MSFMKTNYPNLDLLEFKAQILLEKDDEFMKKVHAKQKENKYAPLGLGLNFDVIVFPQIWGSTCLGFDQDEFGGNTMGGCAMTKAYTTVFHETLTDTYVVFFGQKAAYSVTDASEQFYKDLNNRQMASLSQAKKEY